MPGASAAAVAMALSADGMRLAAAQDVKPLYPEPYMPTRPSLQVCPAIHSITARASAPSCSYGITGSTLARLPRAYATTPT